MHLLWYFLSVCLLMFIVHKASRAEAAALCCCTPVSTLQSWEPPSSAGSPRDKRLPQALQGSICVSHQSADTAKGQRAHTSCTNFMQFVMGAGEIQSHYHKDWL